MRLDISFFVIYILVQIYCIRDWSENFKKWVAPTCHIDRMRKIKENLQSAVQENENFNLDYILRCGVSVHWRNIIFFQIVYPWRQLWTDYCYLFIISHRTLIFCINYMIPTKLKSYLFYHIYSPAPHWIDGDEGHPDNILRLGNEHFLFPPLSLKKQEKNGFWFSLCEQDNLNFSNEVGGSIWVMLDRKKLLVIQVSERSFT